jgi:DNA-binding NarL/FixJ family response regulator
MDIVIVDDDKLVASSLKIILEADPEVKVAAVGYSGAEAVALYRQHRPDILLLDIRMGEMSGLEAAKRILEEDGSALILFLTTFSDDEYIVKALKIGARGYLLKQDFAGILPALRAVLSGQTVFGGEIVSRLPDILDAKGEKGQKDYDALGISDREWEVTALVAEGLSNREIAARLYLSEGTVRNYISTVLEKLKLRDRTQLAVFYLKR